MTKVFVFGCLVCCVSLSAEKKRQMIVLSISSKVQMDVCVISLLFFFFFLFLIYLLKVENFLLFLRFQIRRPALLIFSNSFHFLAKLILIFCLSILFFFFFVTFPYIRSQYVQFS